MTDQPTDNFELILEGDSKAITQMMALFESGELEKILGVPVLGVDADSTQQTIKIVESTALTGDWFGRRKVTGWLYEIGTQASRLVKKLMENNNIAVATLRGDSTAPKNYNHLDKIVSKIPAELLSEIGLESSENTDDILIGLINSSHLDWIKFIAYELGNLSNVPAEVIETLATRISTIEDSETRWQLALTLGQLEPDHPLGAVGQTKILVFPTDDWFDLFLALRVSEDDFIDVLLEVTSNKDEYLPVGLQVSLLDEAEEIFSEAIANQEDKYLNLEFTEAIGQFFSVKLSLGGNDVIENFVI